MGVMVCVMVSGLSLWVLQQLWVCVGSERSVELSKALLYSWGALLEQPPLVPFTTATGKVSLWRKNIKVLYVKFRK